MFLIGFIVGAMVGGTIAIFFHCCLILGKESDSQWVEEKIITKEKELEKKD